MCRTGNAGARTDRPRGRRVGATWTVGARGGGGGVVFKSDRIGLNGGVKREKFTHGKFGRGGLHFGVHVVAHYHARQSGHKGGMCLVRRIRWVRIQVWGTCSGGGASRRWPQRHACLDQGRNLIQKAVSPAWWAR
jgi:hypothetical protein